MSIESLRTDESINEIFSLYSDMVYRIAVSMVKSKTNADDIYQDVFYKYFKKHRHFESEEHRKYWIIKTTINTCKKYWSSSWFKKTIPLEDNFIYEQKEENLLQDELDKLPSKYKIVIHLFYFEDMSVSEISKSLHINEGTVRMQLTRGRRMLKENIGGDFFD
ncbi:MAG: RNA polymerase sigma factor [Beduini sp.]|mgnify:CR=1 FL=1|uniref:RNA polymerase sigma factor n=1 Tax=Beduini sp. TaxID=1922300 RepID=UPI0011C967FD